MEPINTQQKTYLSKNSILSIDVAALNTDISSKALSFFKELQEAHLTVLPDPSDDSVLILYKNSNIAWSYYERAQEIYRLFLLQKQKITALKARADSAMNIVRLDVTRQVNNLYSQELSTFRSQAAKDAYMDSFINPACFEQLAQVNSLFESCKVYLETAKSFVDQFKSARENILMQLSLVKTLIALGHIKLSPEVAEQMASLNQTLSDAKSVQEVSVNEGNISFGAKLF